MQAPATGKASDEEDLTENSVDEPPRLVDDDTSSSEEDDELETAKQSVRSVKGLVRHPMELIAMLRERSGEAARRTNDSLADDC